MEAAVACHNLEEGRGLLASVEEVDSRQLGHMGSRVQPQLPAEHKDLQVEAERCRMELLLEEWQQQTWTLVVGTQTLQVEACS